MLRCKNCGSDIPDIEEKCLTCGFSAGPPNVRTAERIEEREALEGRYVEARRIAAAKGCLSILENFEQGVTTSVAVVNMDAKDLFSFVTGGRGLYTNYEVGVEAGLRKPAALEHDRQRRGIGGSLFGTYASKIMYAGLSLDGLGSLSYGPYSMRLRDVAVRNRATVLENNSYHFIKKHGLGPGDKLPAGYTATWENRHKLAVAKVAEYITPSTADRDFPQLLLSSTGDRATDELIEVQIYGTFDINAVESVKGSSKHASRDDRDLLRMVKDHLHSYGKDWIEV